MGSNGVAVPRRTVIIGASALLIGCVDGNSGGDGNGTEDGSDDTGEPSAEGGNPATGEVEQEGNLTLTSPAFEDGGQIPEKYGYTAANVNPPLTIENVPDGADSLALAVDDPDAVEPAGKVWDHWIVWNILPEMTTIPEDWDPEDPVEGTNDYGSTGYGGPNPPNSEHRYRFKLFALDTTLDLPPETDAEALGSAMAGHVIEQTQLDGTYPA
jgi:Raf kinase inhibitor-like YbhB/YbcL family protein